MRIWIMSAAVVAMLSHSVAAAPLEVTTGDTWRPYTDENAADGGTITRFVHGVLDRMGHEGEIVHLPWARSYELTRRNRYLATFPWYESTERRLHMLYSRPLAVLKNVVFMRRGETDGLNSWSAVSKGRLCRPVGYTILPQIQTKLDGGALEMVRPPSMAHCMKMLSAGRVDYVMTIEEVGHETIAAAGLESDAFSVMVEPVEQSTLHLLVSKSHPEAKQFLKRFDAELQKMEAEGASLASADGAN